ncbi:MAG: sulfotransferase family protein [Phycisphaeraceae bacterium]
MAAEQDVQTMLDTNAQTKPGDADASPPPVFLVGSERSGTTLLRLMLDRHPQVTWCKEFEFVVDPLREGKTPTIQQYAEYLQTSRIFQDAGFQLRTDLDYAGACRDFLEQRKQSDNKPFVGATVHRHFASLLKVWPDARFIYLKRDGRDVARSCIGMGWDGNVWTASKRWADSVRSWHALRGQLDPSRYIETSYETLISDARGELTRLFDFIGPGFHEDVWDYHEGTTYSEPDPSLIAQWKRKLSPYQLGLVEARIAPLLEMQGYELSGHPPVKITPTRELRLKLQDRWARLMYRWRNYGVLLSVGESLTKRTGPKPLHKRILKNIHEKQNALRR